jgi:hypothetical protein
MSVHLLLRYSIHVLALLSAVSCHGDDVTGMDSPHKIDIVNRCELQRVQ